MQNRQSGFAIVLVILFTLLTLAILVTTISLTASNSNQGTSRAGQSTQALLAADSGVSTFVARVKEGGFNGTLNELACWVQGFPLAGLTCEPSATAKISTLQLSASASGARVDVLVVDASTAESSVTIQSTGLTGSGPSLARAIVTQRVNLSKPPFLNVSPPAALTSCPGITGGGTANLSGASASSSDGLISNYITVLSASLSGAGWPATLTVLDSSSSANQKADATLIDTGSYIQLGTNRYVVTGKPTPATLTIAPANPVLSPVPVSTLTGSLSLIPVASRKPAAPLSGVTVGGKSVYRLYVSDPTAVFVNDVMYVKPSSSVSYGVTVVAKDFENGDVTQGYVDVTLGATGAGASSYDPVSGAVVLPNTVLTPTDADILSNTTPGTPLTRYVPGSTSAGTIRGTSSGTVPNSAWGGSSTVTPAAIAGNPTVKCGDALFAQVFNNYTKAKFYNLVPTVNRLSDTPTTPLKRDIYWVGPSTTPSSNSYTLNGNSLCGSGILVINGNLTMKGTGNQNGSTCASNSDGVNPPAFNGLIYVIGNFSNQGNSIVKGAMVVEGNVTIDTTALAGTMSIEYDQRAILNSARNLSPVTFAARAGTWNQQ
ncbi:hypothetical protein DESA109040_19745 [Deinococcus saxicola]|uniref:hypothetical protein n=1 Tax=Deinococcus saxicola TaxID=249406 RepID=UPI0039F0DE0D